MKELYNPFKKKISLKHENVLIYSLKCLFAKLLYNNIYASLGFNVYFLFMIRKSL